MRWASPQLPLLGEAPHHVHMRIGMAWIELDACRIVEQASCMQLLAFKDGCEQVMQPSRSIRAGTPLEEPLQPMLRSPQAVCCGKKVAIVICYDGAVGMLPQQVAIDALGCIHCA